MEDMDHMKRDFPVSSDIFFQKLMNQSKNLLSDHLYALKTYKSRQYEIHGRFRSPSPKKKGQKLHKTLADANVSQVYKLMNDARTKKLLGEDNLMPSHSNMEWTEDSRSVVKNKTEES